MSELPQSLWQKTILEQIFYLKANALPEATYDQMLARQAEILKPNRGYLTWYEWKEYYDIEDQLEQTRIRVQTLPEFRFVLENFGFRAPDLQNALAHENAHVNVAEQFNAVFEGYMLNVTKRITIGRLVYVLQPEVDIDVPDDWSDEVGDNIARAIILAPVQYGSELSEGDQKLLARLER